MQLHAEILKHYFKHGGAFPPVSYNPPKKSANMCCRKILSRRKHRLNILNYSSVCVTARSSLRSQNTACTPNKISQKTAKYKLLISNLRSRLFYCETWKYVSLLQKLHS